MKNLSTITCKDELRPALNYLQIRAGFVWATNCHVLVKVPLNECWLDQVITQDEELYILNTDWHKAKFETLRHIERKPGTNEFTTFDKKMSKIWSFEALSLEKFTHEVGRFPDCEAVIPAPDQELKPVQIFGIDANYLAILQKAFNSYMLVLYAYGENRAFLVRSIIDGSEKSFGLIMPCALNSSTPENPFEGLIPAPEKSETIITDKAGLSKVIDTINEAAEKLETTGKY